MAAAATVDVAEIGAAIAADAAEIVIAARAVNAQKITTTAPKTKATCPTS